MNDTLVRNILILDELKEIIERCEEYGIKVMLLKGVAMLHIFEDYIKTREIEDIDLLVDENDFLRFLCLLKEIGYKEFLFSPFCFFSNRKLAMVDVHNSILYLNKCDTRKVWARARKIGGFVYLPSYEDLLRDVLYHRIQHCHEIDKKWDEDLSLLVKECMVSNDRFRFLCIPIKNVNNKVRFKNNVLLFLAIPFGLMIIRVLEALFPSNVFIKHRYNATGIWFLFFRIFRPMLIFYNLILFLYNSIVEMCKRCYKLRKC